MFKKFLLLIIIFSLGLGFGSKLIKKNQLQSTVTVEKNTPKAFVGEIYDKIKDNYWDNISETQLLDLFRLSISKNGGLINSAKFDNKDQLKDAILNNTKDMEEDQRNKFLASVVNSVLLSLNPVGRSSLYSQAQEQQLQNTVSNVNPQKNLYGDLGLPKGASETAVNQAFEQNKKQLASDKSPQAVEKLKQISYAKDVLTQKDTKTRYDQSQVEPTIFTRVIQPDILYVQFKKFSPTSLDEFQKAFEREAGNHLTSLILDLRGNIGGAIDSTTYFLGFFLGKNQTAFDFYHKGEFLPFKTPVDKLPSLSNYKQIVILIDNGTQSSAELMVAALKKYHIGLVLGSTTKGWGTVEKIFPLDNQISTKQKYSLFLVHSITLREDNQPIEGRGVSPDIDIKNMSWEQDLYSYFRNPELTSAIKEVFSSAN